MPDSHMPSIQDVCEKVQASQEKAKSRYDDLKKVKEVDFAIGDRVFLIRGKMCYIEIGVLCSREVRGVTRTPGCVCGACARGELLAVTISLRMTIDCYHDSCYLACPSAPKIIIAFIIIVGSSRDHELVPLPLLFTLQEIQVFGTMVWLAWSLRGS
ncbi:hypothetical protein NDU88_000583 [Pleurodeles waltl]|uniref:Uncharacterized protein n=1 Tax=Pleurodeles waltl TaxID=8319 RepID=A0AAV7U3Y6_PLEWA|nr:hypothetical protein NDU88_000583 [Pleurodeles waltl]